MQREPLPPRPRWGPPAYWLPVAGLILLLLIIAALGVMFGRTGPQPAVAIPAATSTPATAPGPVVQIAPAQGGPGTPVNVGGAGWQAGEVVSIRLADPSLGPDTAGQAPVVATATGGQDGTFQTTFTYPADPQWLGRPQVLVVGRSATTGREAYAVFVVVGTGQAAAPLPSAPTATPVPPSPPQAGPQQVPGVIVVPPTATPLAVQPPPAQAAVPTPDPNAWRGEYFPNPDLSGAPALVRNDREINFEWGDAAPAPGFPADMFSVRWTRTVAFDGGLYRFQLVVDEGVRVLVDGQVILDEWRDAPRREVRADREIGAGAHEVRVEYYDRSGTAAMVLSWQKISSYPDWKGEYWSSQGLEGNPVLVRNDQQLNFNWGSASPDPSLPADRFSARWTRSLSFDQGNYRFNAIVAGGVRIYVDDKLVLDAWDVGPARQVSANVVLGKGPHNLRVEYHKDKDPAQIEVWWEQIK